MSEPTKPLSSGQVSTYRVTEQIGHILRRAAQKHATIFSEHMAPTLTPTRFAAMCMLYERGPLSQNELGRLTAMDSATIKGVVDRLSQRGLATRRADPDDARRSLIELTEPGRDLLIEAIPIGIEITEKNLKPLTDDERQMLIKLLKKIS